MQIELSNIVNGTNEGNFSNIICRLTRLRYNQLTADQIELVGHKVQDMREIQIWVCNHRRAKNQIIEFTADHSKIQPTNQINQTY